MSAEVKKAVLFGAGFVVGVMLGEWVMSRVKVLLTARA